MGRPKIPIDAKEVELLAAIGCSAQEIAIQLTPDDRPKLIHHDTIERRFAASLKKGRHKLARLLKKELVRQALSEHVAC